MHRGCLNGVGRVNSAQAAPSARTSAGKPHSAPAKQRGTAAAPPADADAGDAAKPRAPGGWCALMGCFGR